MTTYESCTMITQLSVLVMHRCNQGLYPHTRMRMRPQRDNRERPSPMHRGCSTYQQVVVVVQYPQQTARGHTCPQRTRCAAMTKATGQPLFQCTCELQVSARAWPVDVSAEDNLTHHRSWRLRRNRRYLQGSPWFRLRGANGGLLAFA